MSCRSVRIVKERCIEVSKRVFRDFGFVLYRDGRVIEYSEVLLGQELAPANTPGAAAHGSTASVTTAIEMSRLRFDLTVPFARFAAQHRQTIGMPFRRYHIAPAGAERTRKRAAGGVSSCSATSTSSEPRQPPPTARCSESGAPPHGCSQRRPLRTAGERPPAPAVPVRGGRRDRQPRASSACRGQKSKQGPGAVADELERIGLSSDIHVPGAHVCAIRGQAVDLQQPPPHRSRAPPRGRRRRRRRRRRCKQAGARPVGCAGSRLLHEHCLRDVPG